MTTQPPTWERKALAAAAVVARWAVGALFIYMGLKKAMHPVEFLKLVRQYEMVHSSLLLNSIAAGLPWFEVFCGALLLAGIAVRGAALTLVAILVPFTGLVFRRALALQTLRAIPFCAVKFDCGCGAGEVFICGKLAENFVLILLLCWLLSETGRGLRARQAALSGANSGTP
jgi:uncharacterized membrane protein YphA (DoxX/SURF4 family)